MNLSFLTPKRLMLAVLAAAFVQIAIFTFTSYTEADEGAHLGTGLELLSNGTYKYERLHPPFARVWAALPSYLFLGRRQPAAQCDKDFDEWRYEMAASGHQGAFGHYCLDTMPHDFMGRKAVYLGRIMQWPLYFLMCFGVYLLARELKLSKEAAIFSATILGVTPIFMWLSRVVMTDLAFVCFATLTLYALLRVINRADVKSALLLGGCAGMTALSKFTAFYFVPVIGVLWLFLALREGSKIRTLLPLCSLAFAVAAFIMAAGWLFDPMAFWEGVMTARMKAQYGHANTLLRDGQLYMGALHFYPMLLFIRTPIALQFAMGYGGASMWKEARRLLYYAGGAALIVMAMAIPTKVNINIHHIALIYVPLAVMAGYGCGKLWQSDAGKVLVAALFAILLSCGPHFLTHENTVVVLYRYIIH